jgi:hypothetical protein
LKESVSVHPGWQARKRGDGPVANDVRVPQPGARVLAVADDGQFVAVTQFQNEEPPLRKRKRPRGEQVLSVLAGRTGAPVAGAGVPADGRPVVFSPKSTWVATARPIDPGSPVERVVCTPVRDPDAPEVEFVGHTGAVRAIAFFADETRMVTGGEDGFVRVWDAQTAECLLALKAAGTPSQLAVAPDGGRIVALVEAPRNPAAYHVRVWEPQGRRP